MPWSQRPTFRFLAEATLPDALTNRLNKKKTEVPAVEASLGIVLEKKTNALEEIFSVLFNLVDLLTRLFGLFGVITDFQQNTR